MKPTVIVWARSPQWCSAISRQLGQFRLSWVLNFESLWSEVLKKAQTARCTPVNARVRKNKGGD